ncbi:hypothetical protein QNE90_002078 [Vibrio alginolyticus]|uniref:hypothetical protein n=1 Tax=Vibrio TaxID=662 RepID=UPI001A182AF5|nr:MULTISPECIES: hypothetical protein [Vibrio]HAS6777661.1 hypothetical protein [Vibrio parahaemolyticus]ELB2862469.1 hypothetical protein [Vibrio alginolyticus]MBS9848419.1 hypothetical protein [Vibrio alginolyticus]MDW2404856.1 hypothetical protein [Vibrio sp. 1262-1]HAS6991868.1 hypothetical protein [Vibrio parahaemolyticus]
MLLEFKRALEETVRIVQWNPSAEELIEIANFIRLNPNDLTSLSAFICETCEDVTLMFLEGQDYSDLNSLLALARMVVEESE